MSDTGLFTNDAEGVIADSEPPTREELQSELVLLSDDLAVAHFEGDAARIAELEAHRVALQSQLDRLSLSERGAFLAAVRAEEEAERLAREAALAEQIEAAGELEKVLPDLDRAAEEFASLAVKAAALHGKLTGSGTASDRFAGVLRELIRRVPVVDRYEERAVRTLNRSLGSDGLRYPDSFGGLLRPFIDKVNGV